MDEQRLNDGISRYSRPIFISSTFLDMHAERDYLRTHVFPRLQEALNERNCSLEPIDLRQGVETADEDGEESRELRVLSVCFDQIRQSRPFFIVLLGDRYGYVPEERDAIAATAEAGVELDVVDKSITALEIEYGINGIEADPARCYFFFRKPLDWDRIPSDFLANFNDDYAADEQVRRRKTKILALQEKIASDPALKDRVYWYDANWNDQEACVSDLRAFGDIVHDAIWPDLDEDTRVLARAESVDWAQRETQRLDDFFDTLLRGYVDRGSFQDQVLSFARSTSERPPWALIVTGPEGAGKSSLAAKICHELAGQADCLLLAHSAGTSADSVQEMSCLRRWRDQLREFLGTSGPYEESDDPRRIEQEFFTLLSEASRWARIVVVLDALDAFASSSNSRRLFCFDASRWPSNARLIVSTRDRSAGGHELEIPDTLSLQLPQLSAEEAERIAANVWHWHHREPPQPVISLLVSRSFERRDALAGNPLWITLAADLLNNLTAEDYAAAAEYEGEGSVPLRSLMNDRIREMPRDLAGLYSSLFSRAETAFGTDFVRCFLSILCAGRSGWRSHDLDHLFSRLIDASDENDAGDIVGQAAMSQALSRYDDAYEFNKELIPTTVLRVAELRRFFLPSLTTHGARQLDFLHRSCREGAARHLDHDASTQRRIHQTIAAYLMVQRPDDGIRCDEIGHHLICAGEHAWLKVEFGSTNTVLQRELESMTDTIVQEIRRRGANWFIGICGEEVQVLVAERGRINEEYLPDAASADIRRGIVEGWTSRCLSGVLPSLRYSESNEQLVSLLEILKQQLLSVTDEQHPSSCLGDLDALLASIQLDRHDFAAAQESLSGASADDPQQKSMQLLQLGDLAVNKRSIEIARQHYEAAMKEYSRLPGKVERDRGISVCTDKLGDLARQQCDYDTARRYYESALASFRKLAAVEPEAVRDLALCLSKLGELEVDLSRFKEARRRLTEYFELMKAGAAGAPKNTERQRDLAGAHSRLQHLEHAEGNFAAATKHGRAHLNILEEMIKEHGENTAWVQDLAGANYMYGRTLLARGDDAGAMSHFEASAKTAIELHDSGSLDHRGRALLIGLFNKMSGLGINQWVKS